jgi:hypothetical protein
VIEFLLTKKTNCLLLSFAIVLYISVREMAYLFDEEAFLMETTQHNQESEVKDGPISSSTEPKWTASYT